jgi:flagellar hook-associated protein 3 FlgL
LQKAELALDNTNRQVATGKSSSTYSGYGQKTAVMEAARSAAARADAHAEAAKQAAQRIDLQDTQLSQLSDLADHVRQTLTKAAADQDGTSLMTQLQGYFGQMVDLLNAKDANGYIYAGDNNQVPPVTVQSLDELRLLPSVSQAFANGDVKTTLRVGENQTVEVGMLASDIGTELFSLFRQIAQFDATGAGHFDTKTSDVQQSFLESAIQTSATAATGINAAAAANGIRYQVVQSASDQLQAASTVHKDFVSNIEDVNIAEAMARLNQQQIALQAAFQMTSKLNQLSLIDYLPNY